MPITIALDLGGTSIKLALVKEGGIIESSNIPVNDNTRLEPILTTIEQSISDLASKNGIASSQFEGIGMAFPSIVDNKAGKILSEYVKYADVNDLSLQSWSKKLWGIPLLFENDARAALVGEWQYGAGIGKTDLVQMTIGTGVGSAVLIDGKVLRGKHFLAGNLGGHVTVNYDGDECNCGNIGCLETVASTWALPTKVSSHQLFKESRLSNAEIIDFEVVFKLAAENDPLATIIRDDCVNAWGFGAINLVHSFDPQAIIIGGGIMQSKLQILPQIQKMVDKHTWLPPGTVEIIAAKNGNKAALLGLDYLVKQNVN
ncbi:MAG: ROK family protein [Cyclobacteriaceae bacterium]